MINGITLKFGALPDTAPLNFPVKPITIFVGPNNSGKSLILQEIERAFHAGYCSQDNFILARIDFKAFDQTEAQSILDQITVPRLSHEPHHTGHVYASVLGNRFTVYPEHFVAGLTNLNGLNENTHYAQQIGNSYLKFMVRRLDGPGRIQLAKDQAFGDLQLPPTSSFQVIFRNDALRSSIRELTFNALGKFLVFDPTASGQIRLRLADRRPVDCDEEQGLTHRASLFHAGATLVSTQSDGIKAFAGIITEVLAGTGESYLLDEPEAFLHPSLAFTLGKSLSSSLSSANKQMFVSTHSSQFLMGCVQSGVSADVIRLTRQNGIATARRLPSSKLAELNSNPFLRSANVLSGLFYESVIVCEADTDRAFYQEINEMLLAHDPDRGISNCLFLNANGKDTIPQIVSMLRSLGIPTAAIYDIDYVKDGGTKMTTRLNASGVPSALHQSFSHARIAAKDTLEKTGKNFKTAGGITLLSGDDFNTVRSCFDALSQYGSFIVPLGEVESWLSHLGHTNLHGPQWLTAIFNTIDAAEASASPVRPSPGDVWDFIASIKQWLSDPMRQGIPEKFE